MYYALTEAEVKKALHQFRTTVSARVETYAGNIRAATVQLNRLRINMLMSSAEDQRLLIWHELWSVILQLAQQERCQVAVVYETTPHKALFIWPLHGQLAAYEQSPKTKKAETHVSAFPAFLSKSTPEQCAAIEDAILNPGLQFVP